MHRLQLMGLLTLAAALCCALLTVAHSQSKIAKPSKLLKTTRQSLSDLEVTGLLAGVPPASHRFITYHDLLGLPQVKATLINDENFAAMKVPKIKISGVYLSVLAEKLGAPPSADLIQALCTDKYLGIVSSGYIAAHKPILILKVNDLTPAEWANKTHNEDPGPYLVGSVNFKSSYNILGRQEMPQVPENVVALSFESQNTVFAAIAPPGRYASGSPQQQGFAIARVLCLKCHNAGPYGGTKANRSWSTLSKDAIKDPAAFAKRIHDPKSIDPAATMPPNPDYDAASLAALTAYFQSLPTE
jgi:hypothetical protein